MTEARPRSRNVPATLVARLLTPIVEAVATAAGMYAARKAPELYEEKVAPRLRELARASTSEAEKLPLRAESVLGGAASLAEGLSERAASVAEAVSGHSTPGRSISTENQREKERAGRAARREARRRELRRSYGVSREGRPADRGSS